MQKLRRSVLVLVVLIVAGVLLYPTIKWYCFVSEDMKNLALLSNEEIREYSQINATEDVKALMSLASTKGELLKDLEYFYTLAKKRSDIKEKDIVSILNSFNSQADLFEASENYHKERIMEVKALSSKVLQLGLDLKGGISVLLEADVKSFEEKLGHGATSEEIILALNQDIEILTTRIDQFGLSEPDIRLQGTNQIFIELPGQADSSRVSSFLQGKGSLYFMIVDSTLTNRVNAYFNENPTEQFNSDGSINKPSFIPKDKILAGYYKKDAYDIDVLDSYVVLDPSVSLEGNYIVDAEASKNQMTQTPVVNFTLSLEGGELFADLTRENKGAALAVVLDDKVKSVATINDVISSSGQISGFNEKEASDLAIVLRTASFPIDLEIVSQQVVGASLGSDTVRIGVVSIILGLCLIVIFMICYYGLSGLVATLALFLNLFVMISTLSALSFTITLTSIAGLILTLGMAVDANVIIYERIKEELKIGRSPEKAVELGFSRAFWTIMDSNITTIIAALVLSLLGTSAVKGFAITLTVGIVCSLFTSLFVSHLVFDLFIKPDTKKLSISLFKRRKK